MMSPQKINTFVIKFSNEIKFCDIPSFRSGILQTMEYNANILFHNHVSETEFRYSYPLIQYKRINKKAAIVCIGNGSSVIGDFFIKQNLKVPIKGQIVELNIDSLKPRNYNVQTWDTMFVYKIRKWLPLNSENYERYQGLEGIVEKTAFLERILIGNILSMSKGLNLNVKNEIKCKILSITHPHLMSAKGVKLMAFDVEFKSNFSIPEYVGLGKHASLGFGTVMKKRYRDED